MAISTKYIDEDNYRYRKQLLYPVKTDSIECILMKNDIATIYLTDNNKIKIRKPLKEIEKTLPYNTFIRVSRSALINLEYVSRIEKSSNQTLIIYMRSVKEPLIMTRSYTRKLKGKFII